MRLWVLGLTVIVAASSGCESVNETESPGQAGSSGKGGSSAQGGSSGQGGEAECDPVAEDISQTPREDQNLELLALAHSAGIVADQEVYERIVGDVSEMRALEPAIADIGYRSTYVPNTLGLMVSGDTLNSMEHGDYTAWDCLNSAFRVTDIDYSWSSLTTDQFVYLHFEGVYEPLQLGELYGALPEILGAEPDYWIGDGSTICLTTDADTWHYVFDRGGGDCPSGCTEHEYYYFVSEADGAVEMLGVWQDSSAATPPAWVADYAGGACQ